MSWLRDRKVPPDDGARLGWIARLCRIILRWFTLRSQQNGSPHKPDAPARCAYSADRRPSPPSLPIHALPDHAPPAHEADNRGQADVPAPAAEIPDPEPEHEGADGGTGKPSAQAAPAAASSTDQSAPVPCDPSPPNPITREEEPDGLAAPAEFAKDSAEQEHEADGLDQETSAQMVQSFKPAPQPPPSSIAPDTGSNFEPDESLPADSTNESSCPSPSNTAESEGHAPSGSPPSNDDTSLDSDQTVQETDCVSPLDATEPPNDDTKKTGRASDDQSQGTSKRQVANRPGEIPRYRPRLRSPPAQTPPRPPTASSGPADSPAGTLEASYLITFLPGGWGLEVSVLLGRAEGMPENLNVLAGGEAYPLLAIDENLFEPIRPSNENTVAEGFIAETEGDPVRRWVRSARDLHVFSPRPGVSGFASVPRVLIGQENVVFCRAAAAATVQQCASATGSDPLVEVRGPGIPDGWSCFRGYRPAQPADFESFEEIFLALNPLPDASIDLSGGIASAPGTWVLGSPPVIRVLGAVPSPGELTIDGNPATESSDQGWMAPGWDTLGTHTIRLAGLSRTYAIACIEEDWPSWIIANEAAFTVCGARVFAETGPQALAISGGPYWLVGPSAGDFAFARRSSSGASIAAPPFPPVWALQPFGPGRQSPAIALAQRTPPQLSCVSRSRSEVLLWCQLIRAAGAPTSTEERKLWRQYRTFARSLRRKWR